MPGLAFDRVSKRYRIHRGSRSLTGWLAGRLQSLLGHERRLPATEDFWALREVSFEVKEGQALGVIGPNGPGKSTILKILSRITYPTSGRMHVTGRVGALLEVSAGFHAELTGRENIYLKATILGMRKREIDRKLDAIVSFAELERFIDVPIKRYSTGMALRLGFSVAAHLEPEVLLLDEVLAVGDASFRDKCLQRIAHLREMGTTILFVSHDMASIRTLCDQTLFLFRGEVKSLGATESVIQTYYETLIYAKLKEAPRAEPASPDGSRDAAIASLRFTNPGGVEQRDFRTGDDLVIEVALVSRTEIQEPSLSLAFYEMGGGLVSRLVSHLEGVRLPPLRGRQVVAIELLSLALMPGVYEVTIELTDRSGLIRYDRHEREHRLLVLDGKAAQGTLYLPHRWKLPPTDRTAPQSVGARDVWDRRLL